MINWVVQAAGDSWNFYETLDSIGDEVNRLRELSKTVASEGATEVAFQNERFQNTVEELWRDVESVDRNLATVKEQLVSTQQATTGASLSSEERQKTLLVLGALGALAWWFWH